LGGHGVMVPGRWGCSLRRKSREKPAPLTRHVRSCLHAQKDIVYLRLPRTRNCITRGM
jgi:hypothetical protein